MSTEEATTADALTAAQHGAEGLVRALDETPELLHAVLRHLEPRLVSAWQSSPHYTPGGPRYERHAATPHVAFNAQVDQVKEDRWVWYLCVQRTETDEKYSRRGTVEDRGTAAACVDGILLADGYLLLGAPLA